MILFFIFFSAEGSFGIFKNNSAFSFKFQIGLHKDDEKVLIYLKNYFNIGQISYYDNAVRWMVVSLNEIKIII